MTDNFPQNPLLASTGTQIELLKRKQLSSSELLEMTLARIDTINPSLNAAVTLDVERAKREAEEADKRLPSGQDRPLEGLIITIKDSIDVTGMTSTSGAPVHSDRIPERDATVVSRLRQAGTIIVGKTNVPYFHRRFSELQQHLRGHEQPVGPNPFARWFIRRCGGRRGDRNELFRTRLRFRRVDPLAGACLWNIRTQTELRPRVQPWPCASGAKCNVRIRFQCHRPAHPFSC